MENIVGLHGFWGGPDEYAGFEGWFPDLFARSPLDPTHNLDDWTDQFLKMCPRGSNLIGYSQGGRLALHAFLKKPSQFNTLTLLSTHPGGLSLEEQAARRIWIDRWKGKFATSGWEQLETEWQNQEVFKETRTESKRHVERELLVAALENWSVLEHRFSISQLRNLPSTVRWVFGARDVKYCAIKERLEVEGCGGQFQIIADAGHRLLKDAPAMIRRILEENGKCF